MSRRLIVLFTLIVLSPSRLAARTPSLRRRSPPAGATASSFRVTREISACRSARSFMPTAGSRLATRTKRSPTRSLIRRLRPYLRGRFAQHFEFYVNPDFAGGTLVVQDAYVDTVFAPAFRHAGRQRQDAVRARAAAPVVEHAVLRAGPADRAGARTATSACRCSATSPAVSSAIRWRDERRGRRWQRAMSIRATARISRAASWSGRSRSGRRARCVGWRSASPASRGTQAGAGALPALRTTSLQQPYFSYSGARRRRRPHPLLAAGLLLPQGVRRAARIRAQRDCRSGRARWLSDIGHEAWQVAGSWVLTGEAATDAVDRSPSARELRFRRRALRRVSDRRPLSRADGRRPRLRAEPGGGRLEPRRPRRGRPV